MQASPHCDVPPHIFRFDEMRIPLIAWAHGSAGETDRDRVRSDCFFEKLRECYASCSVAGRDDDFAAE
jgi:hypothetical protein